jgi:hypothetical protein
MGTKRKAFRILVGNVKETSRWEDNIKMDVKKVGC